MSSTSESASHSVEPTQPEPRSGSKSGSEAIESVRAERDEWRARAEEAEAIAERLADQIVGLRRDGPGETPLFDTSDPEGTGETRLGLSPDGGDPRIIPMVIAAVAVVMTMVALLSVVNNHLFSYVTVVLVVIAAGLWWGAYAMRVVAPEVVLTRAVVLVEHRNRTYRFDLEDAATHVDVVGEPADPGWRAHLSAPGVATQSLDRRMVDPEEFTEAVERWHAAH